MEATKITGSSERIGSFGVEDIKHINTSKDVPWYIQKISPRLMSPPLVELLESYAGVPPAEQEKHLHEVVRIPHLVPILLSLSVEIVNFNPKLST